MAVTSGSTKVPGQVRSMAREPWVVKQSIYEESSTPLSKVGTRLQLSDGRVFHYAKNGAVALADGVLLQGAAPAANHLNCALAADAAVGDTKVKVTLGATETTLNEYAEGFLSFNDVAPEGTYYKISSHLAADASAAVWINLYDPLWKAATTSSEVTLTKNPYDGALIAPNGGFSQIPIGVALIDVTIGYYFWCQTWGPCNVLAQGTIVIAQRVGLGGTADGAVGPMALTEGTPNTGLGQPEVGYCMRVNASTEYALIFLRLAP